MELYLETTGQKVIELATQTENEAGQNLKKFELENRLQKILQAIEEAKKSPLKKSIRFVFDSFCQEGKKRPLITLTKVIVSIAGLGAIYPAIVGSWACIKTLIVIPLSELESADRETAMIAAQGIGNAGMAITYMVQLHEFVFHPITRLFTKPYKATICEEIRTIYNKTLLENRADMNPEEIDFLIQRENEDLSHYNGFSVSDTINIDEIQNKIDCEIEKRLSLKNVILLTISQIKKDVQGSSWVEISLKIAKAAIVVGLAGGSSFILSVGTYGCYKPFALQSPIELESSDATKVTDAVANYANAGHGLEYVAVMGILCLKAIRSIVGSQYDKALRSQIQQVYREHIEDKSQPRDVSDLLHKRMKQELSHA